jgi:hypothetical protein
LAKDARPTLLGAQDRQCIEQATEEPTGKGQRALEQIRMAETKRDALAAFDAFVETYDIKYKKAVECLTKDRDALLAFSDFPAEHWKHLRTSNPVERDLAPPDGTLEGVSIEQNRSRHDLQACSSRRETLASPRWTKPIAKGHSRGKVHRRNRGRQTASSNCRLTSHVTNI